MKVLNELRIRRLYDSAFVRLNSATMRMLTKIENFVTFGFPSRKIITDLVQKRAFTKYNQEKVTPLNSNLLIEQLLGEHGIICVEDIVHQIHKSGKLFEKINRILW